MVLLSQLLLLSTTRSWQPAPTVGGGARRRIAIAMSSESGGERRSVSDYMGGVHAGKYDFSAGLSGVTSFAYEKSVVFDDVATGGRRRILAKLEDDAVPKWASRTVSPEQRGTIDLSGAGRGATEGVGVVLSNEEISWEPFFATLETMDG